MSERIESIEIMRGFAVVFILLLMHGYWIWVLKPYPIFNEIFIQIAYFGTDNL